VDLLERGNRAPALIKEADKLLPVNALVVFYESGCNNCDNELVQLRGNYSLIKEKGYDIISVSADRDKETFEKTSNVFPWKEKMCDFQGFEGINFRNYGIVGTPTIFITDKDGTIIGRYARLVDTKILN
jgi:thioredoxin-related protein